MTADEEATAREGRWDGLIAQLRSMRMAGGEPSYAELTRRLVEQRLAEGTEAHAARIAKSSVHDAFRLGRSRVNIPLTRELVRVLGGDPSEVDGWIEQAGNSVPEPASIEPSHEPETIAPVPAPGATHVLLLMAACLGLNLLGRAFVDFFAFPIYLDMIGTAIAAIALGPWRGAAVGLSTNVVAALLSGWISLPFAAVNVAGALVWGYGVRRWGMGRSLPRFFVLNMIAALACSAAAVPILLTLVADRLREGHDTITRLVEEPLGSLELAVAFSNVLTSSADKLISGFVALVVVSALPLALRRDFPLVLAADPEPHRNRHGRSRVSDRVG